MKCPKCGYLGYERVERCRNCGYEFSLVSAGPTPDLPLRDSAREPQPLDDLDLIDAATPALPADRFSDAVPDRAQVGPMSHGLGDLPLFGAPANDDVPLIRKASAPRPPLSVRRSTPEIPRLRSEPRTPMLEWPDPPNPAAPLIRFNADRPSVHRAQPAPRAGADVIVGFEPADVGPRALAALIDLAVFAVVDLLVVYFTMKICRLSVSEVAMLPKAPLLTFLLIQNGGYLVAFTTTGQTLGKMITGVRVLSNDSDTTPDVGRSVLRAVLWMILALPAGLGLFTASLSRDGRGLHDRFAGTRVVRAGA